MKIKLILLVTTFMMAVFPAFAVETSIAYQGVLRNEQGGVLETQTHTVEFRLYAQAAGGAALWGRSQSVQLDTNGLFNAELSDAKGSELQDVTHHALADALKAARGTSLFIGLTVTGSSGEISPRQKILTVPYANYAQDVDTALGGFTVNGHLSANAGAHVTSAFSVDGAATFNGEATFSQKTTVNADLTVGNSGQFIGRGTVPIGTILMYYGSTHDLPHGWVVCDGQNGTPDLRGRFVAGVDPNNPDYTFKKTGGADKVQLSLEEMPRHSHGANVGTVGYKASWKDSQEAVAAPGQSRNNGTQYQAEDYEGGYKAHENRPPYYALYYIMRKL
ncbi:MAG: hypothetical protein PHO37_00440 [Kiritimatiellae bacterium]|nr:hypothetical protein [Kiritimatiellia bacterium]